MLKKKKLFFLFMFFCGLFLIVMVILIKKLPSTERKVRLNNLNNNNKKIEDEILKQVEILPNHYKTKRVINEALIKKFIQKLNDDKVFLKKTYEPLRNIFKLWLTKIVFYDLYDFYLIKAIRALKTNKIIKSDVDTRGTQLKLLLYAEENLEIVFKPKWYSKEAVINGPVYSGKDRFNSEIIAFYLSGILQKPLVPVSIRRKISLSKEIFPTATEGLRSTIYSKNNSLCVYGECFYCSRKDPVCEENGFLEGAAIINYNISFNVHKHPWRRTYKKGKRSLWEENNNYCQVVQKTLSEEQILDLIDIAIFDFLMQNGDRHRYETLQGIILFLDNGKGLGNPHVDHIDILAPLYQCCRLHKSTWEKFLSLSGGRIKEYLLQMPEISELITNVHLDAIERRLLILYATIEYCKKSKKLKLL